MRRRSLHGLPPGGDPVPGRSDRQQRSQAIWFQPRKATARTAPGLPNRSGTVHCPCQRAIRCTRRPADGGSAHSPFQDLPGRRFLEARSPVPRPNVRRQLPLDRRRRRRRRLLFISSRAKPSSVAASFGHSPPQRVSAPAGFHGSGARACNSSTRSGVRGGAWTPERQPALARSQGVCAESSRRGLAQAQGHRLQAAPVGCRRFVMPGAGSPGGDPRGRGPGDARLLRRAACGLSRVPRDTSVQPSRNAGSRGSDGTIDRSRPEPYCGRCAAGAPLGGPVP